MDRFNFEENGGALVIKFYVLPSGNLRELLKEYGYKYYHNSKSWVGRKHIEDVKHAVFAWERRSKKLEGRTGRNQTLCCNCARAGFGCVSTCPWEREFKPVPGWTAARRDIKMAHKAVGGKVIEKMEESYLVIECPLYLKEEKSVPARKTRRTAGAKTGQRRGMGK